MRALRTSALAAVFLVATALPLPAGDGTFGVPPSGILPPPQSKQTAALSDTTGSVPVSAGRRVSRGYDIPTVREPAEGAGRSRAEPEPAVKPVQRAPLPALKKPRSKTPPPVPTVDPAYRQQMMSDAQPQPQPAPAAEPRRGLFTAQATPPAISSYPQPAAAAAYAEYRQRPFASAPAAAAASAGTGDVARDGTPCYQLRGLFTSPVECR